MYYYKCSLCCRLYCEIKIFLVTKVTQYLPHLRSKNWKVASKNPISSMAFLQNHLNAWSNFLKSFSFDLVLSFFFWQICSILNNCGTVGLNITKPPWCTCTCWGLSNGTSRAQWGWGSFMVWEIYLKMTTKTSRTWTKSYLP